MNKKQFVYGFLMAGLVFACIAQTTGIMQVNVRNIPLLVSIVGGSSTVSGNVNVTNTVNALIVGGTNEIVMSDLKVAVTNAVFFHSSVLPTTAAEAISDGETLGELTFIALPVDLGKGAMLSSIVAVCKDDISTTKPDFEIYLFAQSVTTGAAGAAWGVSDDDIIYCVGGPYRINESLWSANGALNGVAITNGINDFIMPNNGTNVYLSIKSRKTQTPGSTSAYSIKTKWILN